MQCTYPAITPICLPYPGTKALLWIGNLWIKSHVPRHISLACHTNNIQEYCMKKYHRSESTFNSVYWDGIECPGKCGTKTQLMHTSKIMHGWLPVMHMVGPFTNLTQQCPGVRFQNTWRRRYGKSVGVPKDDRRVLACRRLKINCSWILKLFNYLGSELKSSIITTISNRCKASKTGVKSDSAFPKNG